MALSHSSVKQTETQQRDLSVINRVSCDRPAPLLFTQPKPTAEADFSKRADPMQANNNDIPASEIADGRAGDEVKKAIMKKALIDPFEKAGYDFDATLKEFAVRLRDDNLPRDQVAAAMKMMNIYGEQVADLARLGLIKEETRDLVTSVLKR
jgi:hypothetical protein